MSEQQPNNTPTLSVLMPEGVRPTPPSSMLGRCADLGALAYLVDAQGALVSATEEPAPIAAWLRSEPIFNLAQAAALRARDAQATYAFETLFPGCRVAVIAHQQGATAAGYTLVVLLSPEAMLEETLVAGCGACGVAPSDFAREALPMARFGGVAGELVGTALAAAGRDLQNLEEQGSIVNGFTTQLTDSYDTMDLLYSVGRSMREPFNPHQFLSFVSERLFATMSFRWLAICFGEDAWIANGLRGRLLTTGSLPSSKDAFRTACLSLVDGGTFPRVLERLPDLCTQAEPQVLAQPLVCKGRPVGVLVIGGKYGEDPDISSYDIQLVEAAGGYINAFSDNVALYEDQHNLFMGTVQALTAAIDAKDRYTFGHSERVAHLASELSLKLGMTVVQAERVRIAGLVHDVGKIGVPEAVLCKQGKLTDEEFEAIKKHPEIGHLILRDISLLDDVLPGVLHHHERYDGRGYPHKIAGESIPMIARILAVADTFDAMSSNRSYRSAMPREVVLAEIAKCAGSQFDPDLAKVFLQMDLTQYDRMVARHAEGHMHLAA